MRRGSRLLGRLACRDIAPRPDDLRRLAVGAPDQVLLVVDPAVGAVLAAEAVLHRVDPVLEEPGNGILDSGQVVGVDPVAPEGWVLQVF